MLQVGSAHMLLIAVHCKEIVGIKEYITKAVQQSVPGAFHLTTQHHKVASPGLPLGGNAHVTRNSSKIPERIKQ